MNKQTTRPLLVEALEKATEVERKAYQATQEGTEESRWLASVLEAWQLARLHRAVVELQLWLADRQWEREEQSLEVREGVEAHVREFNRANASQTTKP